MCRFSMVVWLAICLIPSVGCVPSGHVANPDHAPTVRPDASEGGPAEHPSKGGQAELRGGTIEHWYRLDVDGTPAGWMLSRESVREDKLTTVSRLHLRFKRASSTQTLEFDSRFVETLDGQPVSAWSRQTLGPQPIETTWKFLPGEVLVETVHGETSRQQRMALPPTPWLTPGQIQPRLRRLLADGERHFTIRSIDPQLGLEIIDTEWILDAEEELRVDGAPVPTYRFRQRQSFMPDVETVSHVDADGLTVRSTTPMMGFTMTSALASRDQALASHDSPELLARTFIYPDRPIASPRRLQWARYEIRRSADLPTGEGLFASLPSTGAQRVDIAGAMEDAVHVVVEVGAGALAGDPPDLEPYLRSSTFVDHRSSGVQSLLAKALGAGGAPSKRPAAERAEALRAFVADHLRDKNLDSILATASEVAASRSGDCTEHSVLLTALLRTADIPARAVTGLVYVEAMAGERNLFGYHMWTQAWVGDRWLDLDATLGVPFDAAHIAFGTTALNDDHATLKELARFATFIGQVDIRVLETRPK